MISRIEEGALIVYCLQFDFCFSNYKKGIYYYLGRATLYILKKHYFGYIWFQRIAMAIDVFTFIYLFICALSKTNKCLHVYVICLRRWYSICCIHAHTCIMLWLSRRRRRLYHSLYWSWTIYMYFNREDDWKEKIWKQKWNKMKMIRSTTTTTAPANY